MAGRPAQKEVQPSPLPANNLGGVKVIGHPLALGAVRLHQLAFGRPKVGKSVVLKAASAVPLDKTWRSADGLPRGMQDALQTVKSQEDEL